MAHPAVVDVAEKEGSEVDLLAGGLVAAAGVMHAGGAAPYRPPCRLYPAHADADAAARQRCRGSFSTEGRDGRGPGQKKTELGIGFGRDKWGGRGGDAERGYPRASRRRSGVDRNEIGISTISIAGFHRRFMICVVVRIGFIQSR